MAAAAESATAGSHQFGSISLGQRGGLSQGQMKISPTGISWKKAGGGKNVDIKRQDISSMNWMRVPRGCQLGVHVKDGVTFNFIGFRDKDFEPLQDFCKQQYSCIIKEMSLSTSGRNWGGVAINGKSLVFMVDGKVAFEVPLPDVAQAQQVKDDVILELHQDDDAITEKEDGLVELAFHVPPGHPNWLPTNTEEPSSKALLDALLQHTDVNGATADDAVASFSDVHVLAPRGRFEVKMSLGLLQLEGQTQDFKIRYPSIQRIFLLPKSASPHTLVVVSLDPPIRKGQTYYTHILCQFPSDEDASIELDITPEALAAKNEKCGGKLEASMAGPVCEVFARALRGLSGAKITRPGQFRNATKDGYAVRCSYKADDGYLYPLDRAFFYVHKPPMLIPFDDVESVELTRLGGNTVSSKTFDLVVRTKSNLEHQFRGIARNEWQGLLDFFQLKRLRIERLREAQAGPAIRALGIEDDEEGTRGLLGDDEDEEDDEDFKAGSEENEESSDGDDSDDAEMVEEEGMPVKPSKKDKKDKEKAPKRKVSEDEDEGEEEAEEEMKLVKPVAKKAKPTKVAAKDEGKAPPGAKKPRAKKDKNAPKGAQSGFLYFSSSQRESVKAANPGIAFGDVGKVLGERWKAASPADKLPFEEMARQDKARYQKAMAEYKAAGGGKVAEEEE